MLPRAAKTAHKTTIFEASQYVEKCKKTEQLHVLSRLTLAREGGAVKSVSRSRDFGGGERYLILAWEGFAMRREQRSQGAGAATRPGWAGGSRY